MARTGNKSDPENVLKQFIDRSPSSRYTLDSERGAPESEICRGGSDSRECARIYMDSKRLFETMQNFGFFCVLPNNPELTFITCEPMPSGV